MNNTIDKNDELLITLFVAALASTHEWELKPVPTAKIDELKKDYDYQVLFRQNPPGLKIARIKHEG